MVQKTVAVDRSLSPVKSLLESQGFKVVDLENWQNSEAQALVVSGQQDNLLNIHDTATEVPVINAEGLTPEEVLHQVKRTVH